VPALPSCILHPCGTNSPPCCRNHATPIHWAATDGASPTGSSSTSSSRCWSSAAATAASKTSTCSATTLRRRRDEWIALGLAEQLHLLVLSAYDRMIGLALDTLAVDGCITKAPCGGQTAGRSPVDRGKQGLKRSLATEAAGIPLATVPAPANRHDSPLLAPPWTRPWTP
jgi:hypothetical protein